MLTKFTAHPYEQGSALHVLFVFETDDTQISSRDVDFSKIEKVDFQMMSKEQHIECVVYKNTITQKVMLSMQFWFSKESKDSYEHDITEGDFVIQFRSGKSGLN